MTERELEEQVVTALKRLPSSVEVVARERLMFNAAVGRAFEVDILVREAKSRDPRVVIELKVNPVHSDALIVYSAKATRHRSIYPALRYGFLAVGTRRPGITPKWQWHGNAFDFLISWRTLGRRERHRLVAIIEEEIGVSRAIDRLAKGSSSKPSEIWRRTEIR